MRSKLSFRGVILTSLTLSLLTACPSPNSSPPETEPKVIASEFPAQPDPVESPDSESPTQAEPTTEPVNPIVAPSNAPIVDAVKLASIALTTENRYLTSKGATSQFKVTLKDASGTVVSIASSELKWSSSRPGDFSVDVNGLATSLIDSGYSDIIVSVGDLSATQLVSVNSADGFTSNSGSSGGGGGGSSAPTEENLNADIFFEGLGIGEFQVNTYTTNSQESQSIAVDSEGNFVIAWSSYTQDGSSDGIYAQRFSSTGDKPGSEFRVNSETDEDQWGPSVGMDADGDFVIAWASEDSSDYGIYAQRYTASGDTQTGEFRLNSDESDYSNPSVGMDPDGNYIIAWESNIDGNSYGYSVSAKRFNAAGEIQ